MYSEIKTIQQCMVLLTGDAANSKCHQRLNKILMFFLHYIWEIRKVVYKKTLSCNTPTKCDAILCKSACACCNCTHGFHTAYVWQEFSCKQLCWFPKCSAGKKIYISSSRWWRLELATSPILLYLWLMGGT